MRAPGTLASTLSPCAHGAACARRTGLTPLGAAVQAYCAPGNQGPHLLAIAELLVQKGASPGAKDPLGGAVLGKAVEAGHLRMVMSLVRNARCGEGRPAQDASHCFASSRRCGADLRQLWSFLPCLWERSSYVDHQAPSGATPLYLAVVQVRAAVVVVVVVVVVARHSPGGSGHLRASHSGYQRDA